MRADVDVRYLVALVRLPAARDVTNVDRGGTRASRMGVGELGAPPPDRHPGTRSSLRPPWMWGETPTGCRRTARPR
jgi:hypothetical protein